MKPMDLTVVTITKKTNDGNVATSRTREPSDVTTRHRSLERFTFRPIETAAIHEITLETPVI